MRSELETAQELVEGRIDGPVHCPACGHADWDKSFVLIPFAPPAVSPNGLRAVGYICRNCGFVRNHVPTVRP